MRDRVPESDWRQFREIRKIALQRLCERALNDVVDTASDVSRSHHERFLEVYKEVGECNDKIAFAFDHLSRSKMIMQLTAMQSLELIDASDLDQLTQETRDVVESLARFQ